jgi:hypothetical protein
MTTLSRFFLILAGLFVGLWLRGGDGALSEIGFPALALLALILAVAGAPSAGATHAKARLEDVYRQWLDAWQHRRTAADHEVAEAETAFASASHALALTANDRIIKALQTASQQDFSDSAVAALLVEMRRSIGRPSLTIRPADLERLFTTAPKGAPVGRRTSSPTLGAHADSFLS